MRGRGAIHFFVYCYIAENPQTELSEPAMRLTKLTELLVALGFPVLPKCTAGAPMMEHVRAYMGFFDIKYSLANILLFYYRTEVLR